MMNAAIAQHLSISESAIIRIEEWANVLMVVAKGIGARFVSKKVAKVESIEEKMSRYEREAEELAAKADAMVAQISDRLPVGFCASYEKMHSAACEILRGETTLDEVVARFNSKKVIKRSR